MVSPGVPKYVSLQLATTGQQQCEGVHLGEGDTAEDFTRKHKL